MTTTQPHASALRHGRYSHAGGVYLITTVTLHRQWIFAELASARALVRLLNTAPDARTLAYVVMPDHLHWLMQLSDTRTLSACVQRLKSLSSKALGRRIWQRGFHDRAIRTEDDLPNIARYIVANPVRAGLVKRCGEYGH